jgi:hypothetical protein
MEIERRGGDTGGQPAASGLTNRHLLRRLGVIGFWFFFLKGCLWIGTLIVAVVWAQT